MKNLKDNPFVDAVKYCIDNNLFTIQEGSSDYGCSGITCHFNGLFQNEFYFGGEEADDYDGPAEEYVKLVGIDGIAEDVAMTIEDMATNGEDYLESSIYLSAMLGFIQGSAENKKELYCNAINNILETALSFEKEELKEYDE